MKDLDKMSKLFQLFSVNGSPNKIGFDEFLNGVSICFVDSRMSDAMRVCFDSCSTENGTISEDEILSVWSQQIDGERFHDEEEYNALFDKMGMFVDRLFDEKRMKQMDFNQFQRHIVDKKLGHFVQEFLQILVLFRLKVKLNRDDFRVQRDDDVQVSVQQHPRSLRSKSILAVNESNLGQSQNTI